MSEILCVLIFQYQQLLLSKLLY